MIQGQEPDNRGVPSVNKNGSVWGSVLVILERMLPSPLWIWQGLVPVWILTVLVSPIPYLLVWGEKKILHIDQ